MKSNLWPETVLGSEGRAMLALPSDRQKSPIAALLTKASSINVLHTGTFPQRGCVAIPYTASITGFH